MSLQVLEVIHTHMDLGHETGAGAFVSNISEMVLLLLWWCCWGVVGLLAKPEAGTICRGGEWSFVAGDLLLPRDGNSAAVHSFLPLLLPKADTKILWGAVMSTIQYRALSEQQHTWLKAILVMARGRHLGWVDRWSDLVWKSHCTPATMLHFTVIKSNLIKYFCTLFFC